MEGFSKIPLFPFYSAILWLYYKCINYINYIQHRVIEPVFCQSVTVFHGTATKAVAL